MPLMTGKRAFIELIRQEGVRYIFGNPGTTELPLMDVLASEHEIQYVMALQESVVMAIASGYSQASGELSIVNLHAAPGLGNAIGMLYDAQLAGAPVLVTAGQQPHGLSLTEPILWADLTQMTRPLVKWAVEVHNIRDLPRVVRRAAKIALTPPVGCVFISLPGDILNAEADIDLGRPSRVPPAFRADAGAIADAARLIAAAERPVILAGDIIAQRGAHAELAALAEQIGAPVYVEGICNRNTFPMRHPLAMGAMPRVAEGIRERLEHHDMLLAIGADLFTLSLPHQIEPLPPGIGLIHLDNDAWQLAKNYPEDVSLLGDPKASLPELCAAIDAATGDADRARMRAYRGAMQRAASAQRDNLAARAAALTDAMPIQPLAAMAAIMQALPDDIVVIDEAISSVTGLREFQPSGDEQSLFGSRGGGIGWGLPGAVGVKLALPDRPVVALVGDGSSLYTNQALWSAAHYKVPVVFIILNNGSYRIIKQRTLALQGYAAELDRFIGMDLTDPAIDFTAMANAFGVPAVRIDTLSAIGAAIEEALQRDGPTLIDLIVDQTFKS